MTQLLQMENHTKGRYPYSGLIQQILLPKEYI